jgi:DivIVA domain-containing protein
LTRILQPVDREDIERRDFPSARRGYDPAAVDAHLRHVADTVTRQRPSSLAEGTSSQVRAILEAAETGAQELRDEAGREATRHVARVEDSARDMLEKLERLHGELDRLFAGLKTTAESLSGALEQLSRDVGTFGASVEPQPASAERATPESAAAPAPAAPLEAATAAEPAAAPEPETAPAPAAPPSNGRRSDDEAGARLVALNMALEGTPREATARFLAEHYELSDVDALLDDVYASAGR